MYVKKGECSVFAWLPLTTASLSPVQVSLLEYRKRKQGTREPECGGSMGTPMRPGSLCPSSESPGGPRTLLQPPASPHSSFSSPAHQAFPQIEEVSPPDLSSSSGSRTQESTSW